MTSDGATLWQADGIPICTAPFAQESPKLIQAPGGDVLLTWFDSRRIRGWDLYAQEIDLVGQIKWPNCGIPFSDTTSFAEIYRTTGDGAGGAIVAWQDLRNGQFSWQSQTNWDIYVGHVTPVAVADVGPRVEPAAELLTAVPNPTMAGVRIGFRVTRPTNVTVEIVDVAARRIRTLLAGASFALGGHDVTWDGRDTSGARAKPGIYFVRLATPGRVVVRKLVMLK